MAKNIHEITANEFDEQVKNGGAVVIDFYSTECPPCEALAPKYEALAGLYGEDVRFLKIFRQENRELAQELGVSSSPTVLFFENGERSGDFLTGGIKRSELMRNLDALVGDERAKEIKSSITPKETECELLILGGGPAGLTAGIYAAQAKIDTIVIDTELPGGQVKTTHQVCNFPGFAQPQQGFMLAHFMHEQANAAGVTFRAAAEINEVNPEEKSVRIDGHETIRAKKLLIATGASPRPLGIPGEKEFKGQGISYCATCDAKFFDDKDVIVIGGGNSAIEESLFLAKFAKSITIVHQFDHLQANKEAQEKIFAEDKVNFIFSHEPRAFEKKEDGGMRVQIEDLKTNETKAVEADGIFVFVGMKPNLEQFNGALSRDDWGYISTDDEMHTNVQDVFAAGDVRSKRYRQITTAVSDGTIAAIAAAKELDEAVSASR